MKVIGLSSEFDNHWIRDNAEHWQVFTEILFRVNGDNVPITAVFNGTVISIPHKHFVFGRKKWSEKLNITPGTVRHVINKLVETGMIEKVATLNNHTVYKILF